MLSLAVEAPNICCPQTAVANGDTDPGTCTGSAVTSGLLDSGCSWWGTEVCNAQRHCVSFIGLSCHPGGALHNFKLAPVWLSLFAKASQPFRPTLGSSLQGGPAAAGPQELLRLWPAPRLIRAFAVLAYLPSIPRQAGPPINLSPPPCSPFPSLSPLLLSPQLHVTATGFRCGSDMWVGVRHTHFSHPAPWCENQI
jgi:hypothetical protein